MTRSIESTSDRNRSGGLGSRARLRGPMMLVAAAAWLGGMAATRALAEPLNPLDFPSLGTVTLAAGAYTLNSSAAPPTLIGPGTSLNGTAVTGVAVFSFDHLIVHTGAVITVTGTSMVALLAGGDLTFAGTINANGGGGGVGGINCNGVGGVGVASGGGGGLGAGSGGIGGGAGGGSGVGGYGGFGGGFGGAGGGRPFFPFGTGPANGVQPNCRLSGGSGGGGGCSGGGAGGGAVELGAIGTLTLTGGMINANGGDGGNNAYLACGGGGGSGGAILLHGGTVNLNPTANALNAGGGSGGFAGDADKNGCGGGGGRVAIQATADPGTAGISVAGGSGFYPPYYGHPGVLSFAQAVLSPTNVNCGSVPVGASLTVALIIQNTGAAGSFINGRFPDALPPFARVGTGIFSGLKQNATTACAYTFTPSAAGAFSQNLTFLSNAGNVSVNISGTGVPPNCRGDFNNDGLLNNPDIPIFVDALLMGEKCPPTGKGDFNNDGQFDAQDVQGFVNALLNGQTCP